MSTWLATLRARSRHLTQISSPWNRKLGPREFINCLNLNGLDASPQNVVCGSLGGKDVLGYTPRKTESSEMVSKQSYVHLLLFLVIVFINLIRLLQVL